MLGLNTIEDKLFISPGILDFNEVKDMEESNMIRRYCGILALLIFLVPLIACALNPVANVRVNISSSGDQGNSGSSSPSISADGRYVAFSSGATNLVPDDTNGYQDIFVRDRNANTTTRVNISSTGDQGNNYSSFPSISADGRYVNFESNASNLVPGDTNDSNDIFVRDRNANTTTRVNISSTGDQDNGYSCHSSISADGRYVVFSSSASNLVPDDTNGGDDIFVHDRNANTTTRVSISSTGDQGNSVSYASSISADGRYVVFSSSASNLVTDDTNGYQDIFVHDRNANTTTRVSISSTGDQGNSFSVFPSISADGRYVAFSSSASNLVPGDTNGGDDIFVHDRNANTTTRVSISSTGDQGNSVSYASSISADGRYVAFCSSEGIFVRDRNANTTTRVNISSTGDQGNGYSELPSISADGRYVAFCSGASNLVPDDTNGCADIFVRDRNANTTTRVSIPSSTGAKGQR